MAGGKKRRALGKGLGALLPTGDAAVSISGKRVFMQCPIEKITPNPYQPRKIFDETALAELVSSVKEKGVLQPLIVRSAGNDSFELIAGERRWRAAQKAGLKEVPVVIKDVSDRESLEIAIIENIQRAELNPVEEAEGYKRLMDEFSYTQEELAGKVGKERATVSNHLRILKLPEEVKKDIADGLLALGHAKALLGLEGNVEIIEAKNAVIKKGMSVRETEALVKRTRQGGRKKKTTATPDNDLAGLEERLKRHFGTKVRIARSGEKGKVEINFYSNEELDRLIEIIGA
ncbi:MAG: ParB/RepB/Spo0J family partition protein [Proteobacteria bacterium]|nr:ParB/RepB/Spo0J family partition protein [Pseudomonadota bacterium]